MDQIERSIGAVKEMERRLVLQRRQIKLLRALLVLAACLGLLTKHYRPRRLHRQFHQRLPMGHTCRLCGKVPNPGVLRGFLKGWRGNGSQPATQRIRENPRG